MYQGKFDAKAKGQTAPEQTIEAILKERNQAIADRAAKKAAKETRPAAPQPVQPVRPVQPIKAVQPEQPALPKQKPVKAPKPEKAPKPAKQEKVPKAEKPAKIEEVQNEQAQPAKRKGPRLGGVIFYTLYFLCIFAFFVGVFGYLYLLQGRLKSFEAAQPTIKSQQVFNDLFANPDWERIYRISGQKDTDFEGAAQYVAYMRNKVGNEALNYVETSAGLSGDKKYIVRQGSEKLATFTLKGDSLDIMRVLNVFDRDITISEWTMGDVEIFIKRNESIRIKKLDNHVAFVNGVPLDESYTIQTASTVADDMLPAGTPKVRTSIQCIDNLMAVPNIVVYDQTGSSSVSVVYNPDTDTYEEQVDAIVMTDAERKAVFGALESYAGFMINASGSRAGLGKYFDSSSKIYSEILEMGKELWMNSDKGHEFRNEEILGFTKHTDNLFSVRASMTMHVNCKDGTEKDYDVLESMFFIKKNGNWVCNEMTNVDITEPIGEVRLTFHDAAGNVISSEFYANNAESLTAPVVRAPEGKNFAGWVRIDTDGNNNKVWTVVFMPDEAGNVFLGNSYALTPMDLHPMFE